MVSRKIILVLFLFALVFPGSALGAVPADNLAWEVIAPGIEYNQFQLADPNNVFVVRMDRTNLNVTLESTIAQGKLSEGKETVSSMFSRYDQALNFWGGRTNPPTWDMRNQVVVAINGSYYDLGSGLPQGGQVQSGWYAKRFDNLGGWSGFAWKLDRSALIGECVNHRPEKQIITYPATGIVQRINDVNDPRGNDELVLFTPQFNSRTGTINSGVEVLVEMARPTLILPSPAFASGIVRQIFIDKGNNLIPFNYVALAASGIEAQTLLENVQVGSEVRISQEIASYESDCATLYSLNWTKTYTSIQGAFFFLKNGQVREFSDPGATSHHPRTAIAYNDQYIFFIVVDGRDSLHSVGMTINELASFTRNTLGAFWGVAQDGGGSSTMVINGKVVNNTYCNIYTCWGGYANYIPIVTRNNHISQSVLSTESNVIESAAGIERAVGNGMLMVIAQPGEYSTKFAAGDQVKTIQNTDLRLGPGTNYASFTTIASGKLGKIALQMNSLNGVLAKSTYWWYVNFGGGSIGWVPEGALVKP
jgi:hypothetical protein